MNHTGRSPAPQHMVRFAPNQGQNATLHDYHPNGDEVNAEQGSDRQAKGIEELEARQTRVPRSG